MNWTKKNIIRFLIEFYKTCKMITYQKDKNYIEMLTFIYSKNFLSLSQKEWMNYMIQAHNWFLHDSYSSSFSGLTGKKKSGSKSKYRLYKVIREKTGGMSISKSWGLEEIKSLESGKVRIISVSLIQSHLCHPFHIFTFIRLL